MNVTAFYSSKLAGSCSGYVSDSQVYSTEGLSFTSCNATVGEYYKTEYGDRVGVIIRELQTVSPSSDTVEESFLDVMVNATAYSSSSAGRFAAIYVSPVPSSDLGDGNWVQCGLTDFHSNSGNRVVSRTCQNIKNTGVLFVAYTQSMMSSSGSVMLKSFNVSYVNKVLLKGDAVLGNGSASITSYKWDFDGNGAYDWNASSSSMKVKFNESYPLSGECYWGIVGDRVWHSSGLWPGECSIDNYLSKGSSGTGVYIRKFAVPMNVPLNVTSNILFTSGNSRNKTASVYVSTVASVNTLSAVWVQCGSTYSTTSSGDRSFSAPCSSLISASGELYVAYTQNISGPSGYEMNLNHFNVTVTSAPEVHGWVYHSFGTSSEPVLLVTDNKGYSDVDSLNVSVS
jgi:hypothetical protein